MARALELGDIFLSVFIDLAGFEPGERRGRLFVGDFHP